MKRDCCTEQERSRIARSIAVAALVSGVACAGLPVRAQVSTSGTANPSIGSAMVVEHTATPIYLGSTANGVGTSGTLDVTNGGALTAAAVVAGMGSLGSGTVNVTGTGSVLNLAGNLSYAYGLYVGSWGSGTMTVADGGRVVCVTVASCALSSIGNGAGSSGTLNIRAGAIEGAGSFNVGQAWVRSDYGTPGAATSGTLLITSGGTLSSHGASIVANNFAQTGSVTGTVLIDGASSQWTIKRDLVGGGNQAGLLLAPDANSSANMTVSNGGSLVIAGSRANPAVDQSIPFLILSGVAGVNPAVRNASSTLTVTSGGRVSISGDTGVINVGRGSGSAMLNITAGGAVSGDGANGLVYMTAGRAGSTGTVNVSGLGSLLELGGVGGPNTQGLTGLGGLFEVGRDAGSVGILNVTGGGSIRIGDNGQAAAGGVGLAVGLGMNATGRVDVAGAGSAIVVSSTGGGTAHPYVVLGSRGSGQMSIRDGASVSVQGVSQRNFVVGWGAGGTGTLNVTNGGRINASYFGVSEQGASATATIDGSSVNLDGTVLYNGMQLGAVVGVGLGSGGTGTLNLQNGAAINIDNSLPYSSVLIGGTVKFTGGTGTLNMSGGSTINFTGAAANARIEVGGPDGVGTMTMTGNSTVNMSSTGAVLVAGRAGSVGTLAIAAGSVVNAGAFAGVAHDGTSNSGGTGTLIVNGTLNAGAMVNGSSGYVGGTGTINVAGAVTNYGVWNVGNSPGTMHINAGSFTNGPGGQIVLEIEALPGGGFATDRWVFGPDTQLDFSEGEIIFSFIGATDPNALQQSGLFDLDTFLFLDDGLGYLSPLGSGLFADTVFSARSDAYRFDSFTYSPGDGAAFLASAVPVPGPFALVGIGLLALAVSGRRRSNAGRDQPPSSAVRRPKNSGRR